MIAYRPGFFTDVCAFPDGRVAHVYESGLSVVCEIEGVHAWTTLTQEPLMFTRCAVHEGQVYSIHQGHDSGNALLVTEGVVQSVGLTFGVQPVAIDGDFLYVVRNASKYDQIELATGITVRYASPVPGSSQGISDVLPDGSLWWADLHRTLTAPGLPTLTYPNERGAVVVGQSDPPQIAGWVNAAQPFTAVPGEGYEPHLVQSGTRYVICARTPKGAALISVPPYPAYVWPAPIPPDPGPTPPGPQPPDPTKPDPPKPPTPEPWPIPPMTPFPPAHALAGVRMKIYAKLGSHYIGVDPGHPNTVYHDRTAANGWEGIELTPHNGGFLARFMDANHGLSVQNDGTLQTRPAGTDGAFEVLFATTQPDGISLLYRTDNGVLVGTPLTIEEIA